MQLKAKTAEQIFDGLRENINIYLNFIKLI